MYRIDKETGVFEIVRGDSADFKVNLWEYNEKGEIIGEYTPEEGDLIYFTVRKSTKDTDPILIQKIGQYVELEPEDTHNLKYGKYVYDVQLTYASGYTDTIVLPTEFKILEEVTF